MLSALLSMINDETDKELVRSLYEANEQLMYNVAYNILHNRTDAEDARTGFFCQRNKSS